MNILRLLKIIRTALRFGLDEFMLGHERVRALRIVTGWLLFWRDLSTPRAVRLRLATPAELAAHDCLVYSSVQGDDRWAFDVPGAGSRLVPVKGPLRSNNLSAVLAACRAGMGVAILPWYVARESVADGAIVPVLADHGLPAQELHAVFPSPKFVPQKVRAFVDFLKEELAGDWWKRSQ